MARLGKIVGIFIVWIIISAIMLEIGLRLLSPSLPGQIGVIARYITTGQPYAENWTRAWQENSEHYYTLRPNIDNELQYGSPTVSFHLTTNKLWDDGLPVDEGIGFRNPPVDYGVDAVVVGDSFGFCFNELDECWVNILAQNTNMGVVNLSQPVTGSISHAKMLADFGAPFEPPLVIWQFFGNDFNDDYGLLSWRGDIDEIPDDNDSTGEDSGSPLDFITDNLITAGVLQYIITGQWSGLPDDQEAFTPRYTVTYGDENHLLAFGKDYERTALDMSRPANQFGYEQTSQALQNARSLVESWDGEMIIVIIPTREEVYEHVTEPVMGTEALDKQRSARLAMIELCNELDITCIDPLPEFQQVALQGEALYYSDDMHLNAEGNQMLANIIETFLDTKDNS